MTSQPSFDDRTLTQYLLGSLPDEDAERIDELSVTDDDVAWRLRAVENDLVDAYVRGELPAETLAKFKSSYLANPERRKRVEIADALRALERPPAFAWRGLAWAAALLVAIAAGAFVVANRTRERPVRSAPVIARATKPVPVAPVETVSVLLLPPMRGTAQIPTVAIPSRQAKVVIRLQLESDDFPEYAATLRDPGTSSALAGAEHLKAVPEARAKVVTLDVPASIFKAQNYTIELSGAHPGATAEVIASYPFRVTIP